MMMGFLIAVISGVLMSLQGVFNTSVTKSSSIWVAAGFVQMVVLFPMEKFVLMREKKADDAEAPEAAPAE